MAFCRELLYVPENGFHHHYHSGVTAVGVVIYCLARPQTVFPEVVDMYFHKPFLYGAAGY